MADAMAARRVRIAPASQRERRMCFGRSRSPPAWLPVVASLPPGWLVGAGEKNGRSAAAAAAAVVDVRFHRRRAAAAAGCCPFGPQSLDPERKCWFGAYGMWLLAA